MRHVHVLLWAISNCSTRRITRNRLNLAPMSSQVLQHCEAFIPNLTVAPNRMCIQRTSRPCNFSNWTSLCQVQPTQMHFPSLARGYRSMCIFIATKMHMAISISKNPGFDICTTTHLDPLYIRHHVSQVTLRFCSVPLALCHRTTSRTRFVA
jgi:hypothetical protein